MKDGKGKNIFLKVFGTVLSVLVIGFVIVFRLFDFASCVGRWIPHKDKADIAIEQQNGIDSVQWMSTPDSSAFSSVGYSIADETLIVQFRDSGKQYAYYGFPEDEWNNFKNSDSLGKYYNSYIKGQYESKKLE